MENPTMETFSAPAGGATALVPPPPGSSFRAMMSFRERGEPWQNVGMEKWGIWPTLW